VHREALHHLRPVVVQQLLPHGGVGGFDLLAPVPRLDRLLRDERDEHADDDDRQVEADRCPVLGLQMVDDAAKEHAGLLLLQEIGNCIERHPARSRSMCAALHGMESGFSSRR